MKVQWIIDRLNDAVGIGNWRVTPRDLRPAATTDSGRKLFEAWAT